MDCASAATCTGHGAGHAMLALQERVAAATPRKWRDHVVVSASSNGWLELAPIEHGDTVWVWNHADLSERIEPGSPVALHELYHALALGTERINVLVATPLG
jgi:hypothetical protein